MATTDFYNILRRITGWDFQNRTTGTRPNEQGESVTTDTSNEVIDSFVYPDKNRQQEVATNLRRGFGIWPFYRGGTDTDNVMTRRSDNVLEYVPFAYTMGGDRKEPLKYGYIVRYQAEPNKNTVQGVILDNREYTADGARDFFAGIKENNGIVRIYADSERYKPSKLSDVAGSTKANGRPENKAFPEDYSIIRRLREANAINTDGRRNFTDNIFFNGELPNRTK